MWYNIVSLANIAEFSDTVQARDIKTNRKPHVYYPTVWFLMTSMIIRALLKLLSWKMLPRYNVFSTRSLVNGYNVNYCNMSELLLVIQLPTSKLNWTRRPSGWNWQTVSQPTARAATGAASRRRLLSRKRAPAGSCWRWPSRSAVGRQRTKKSRVVLTDETPQRYPCWPLRNPQRTAVVDGNRWSIKITQISTALPHRNRSSETITIPLPNI